MTMLEDFEFEFEAGTDQEAITRAAEILAALYGTFPAIISDD
jgi:hypothetical protein